MDNLYENGGAPTPRTDAEAFMLDDGHGEAVMHDFARQLERELAAANATIKYSEHSEKG